MKEITQFETYAVEIWRRHRQRHMNLRVRPDGSLRVTCNKGISRKQIALFIRESEEFIKKCLGDINEKKIRYPSKKFISDESYLYLGERFPLRLVWSWSQKIKIRVYDGIIEITAPLSSRSLERQEAMHKFLQKEAKIVLKERVENFAQKMKLYPHSLSVRGQKTRWGSCSSQGRINLNWKLMAAPPEVIDYVVVHELAHLQHMNHSLDFWSLVSQFLPAYQEAKRWLRAYEVEIGAQFQKTT